MKPLTILFYTAISCGLLISAVCLWSALMNNDSIMFLVGMSVAIVTAIAIILSDYVGKLK
jgi:hypothetical protein